MYIFGKSKHLISISAEIFFDQYFKYFFDISIIEIKKNVENISLNILYYERAFKLFRGMFIN